MINNLEKFSAYGQDILLLFCEATRLNRGNRAKSFEKYNDACKMFSSFEKELYDQGLLNISENTAKIIAAFKQTIENATLAFSNKIISSYGEILHSSIIPSFCEICNEIGIPLWKTSFGKKPGMHLEKVLELKISLEPDSICFEAGMPDNAASKGISFTGDMVNDRDKLLFWLLNCAGPVFEMMPLKDIKVTCLISPEQINDQSFVNQYAGLYDLFYRIIVNTNNLLFDYMWLKGIAETNTNVLFYLFDNESRVTGFFNYYFKNHPGKMFLKCYPNAWNNKLRRWEDTGYRLSITDLISDILKDKIGKIFSINNYLYELFLNWENIYLPWILKYFDIEFIGHDVDPMELGDMVLRRCAGHLEGMARFTVLPILAKEWDEHYKNKGIYYTPLLQHYNFAEEEFSLHEDYSVLVLSQSRRDNVTSQLDLILYLLDRINGNVFVDYQLWYLALRKIMFELFSADEINMIRGCKNLFQTMYHIAQFLKYEVIDSIKTDRRLLIYGDDGWDTVFPQYFKGIHLNAVQITELDRQKRHLHLLFHNSFSYLETGGPVFDAIARNRTFINYPALARTDVYQGFSSIEYTGGEDINRLIENIRDVYTGQDLLASIRAYKSVMKDFENNVVNYLMNGIPYPEDGGEYYRGCREHYILIDRLSEDYAVKNADFILESLGVLISGDAIPVDISKTKYYGRDYVQRLYAYRDRNRC
ncbi:MAG: hypothetical protein FIA99_03465 [Ruminiclostridium sp.]|nr:hypothetical protein [Ruminiclostridium sp.]